MSLINDLQLQRDILRRKLGQLLFDRKRPVPLRERKGKIVLLRWDAKLGDAIVSSWVAREIKRASPEREVWIVTTAAMAPLFRDHFGMDRVIEVPKRPGYGQLKRLAHSLGEVECLVHFGKMLKMKDIYFISQVRADWVAGMDDALQAVNLKLGKASSGMHFSDKFALLLQRLGVTNPDQQYIVPTMSPPDALASWWPAEPVICFNPYGSGSSRRLRPELISQMLEQILAAGSCAICLLYPPGMEEEVAGIRAGLSRPERLLLSPDAPSLAGLFAQLRRCQGLISVDTATVHIAAGLHKPILGLYNPDIGGGNENFLEWHPNSPSATVLFSTNTREQDINSLDLAEFERTFRAWLLANQAALSAVQSPARE